MMCDATFCYACRMFANIEDTWTTIGFNNWRKVGLNNLFEYI